MEDKPNILLDLDNTVICAEADEEYDFKKYKEKAKKFNFKDMDGYYIVFERPHLQEFLDYLFSNFNVSVWTAASKDYALFIIEKILLARKPDRKIDFIFFSYHCDASMKERDATKHLDMIWETYGLEGYGPNNTVIIDDYNEVHRTQPANCIIAEAFEFTKEGSEKDDYLLRLRPCLEKMKKNIASGGTEPARKVNEELKLV